jgi:hypothetical protein
VKKRYFSQLALFVPVVLALCLALFSSSSLVSSAQPIRSASPPVPMEGHGRNQARPGIEDNSGLTGADREVAAPDSSNAVTTTTVTSSGLIIQATFDSSITGNPNAAAIEATINQAIATYQSIFADNVTVPILFRYASTQPGGGAIGSSIAISNYVIYDEPWNTYIDALKADAKDANDTAANATLPNSALAGNVVVSSANGRVLGLDTPTAMFANGNVGNGGPFDGIVTLNSSKPFQFTRPTAAGNYDALRAVQHEIDEVLGLGSFLDAPSSKIRPQDLFSWSSPGNRNLTTSGSRYFSIDGGNTNIVNFNQDSNGDLGDWLSDSCPNASPAVQDAFECPGQVADLSGTSPEGINLDVIGYDLVTSTPTSVTVPDRATIGLVANANNLYVTAENAGNSPLIANRDGLGSWERFQIQDLGNGYIALKSLINGFYVCAENAGASPLIANRGAVGLWEQFKLIDAGNGKFAFIAKVNGKYVCAENAGSSSLIANRDAIGNWEQFSVFVTLQAVINNRIVVAENAGNSPLIANRTAIGVWEQFQFFNAPTPGYFALKAKANGLYVCAENAGNSPLIANRTAIGVWEQFQWIPGGNGNIAIKALVNGLFVTAENAGNNPLIANRTAAQSWEQFQ